MQHSSMMKQLIQKNLMLLMRQPLAQTTATSSSRCFTVYDFSASREFHASSVKRALKPFLLADIGEGITECQIINWFVKPGDRVEQFDRICEVQSDKAAVEITSQWDGTIKTLRYKTDDMATVGQPLLYIDTDEIEVQETPQETAENETVAEESIVNEMQERGGPEAQVPPQPFTPRQPQGSNSILLIPSVRHMLKEFNIDVADVQGTGKDGRITKEDVQRHRAAIAGDSTPSPISSSITASKLLKFPAANAEDRVTPLTATQTTMFKTMTHSLTIPHFLYTQSVDITSTNALRKRLNASNALKNNTKLTLLPVVLKALSQAFMQMPQLNAHLDTETSPGKPQLVLKGAHNFAIAVDTPQGLLVPVIKNVQEHSISSLAVEIQRLSTLAKSGKLGVEDFKGATFTVSNIGSIGGGVVSPIIVAPQVGIVAIGRVEHVPAFESDGQGKEILMRREKVVLSWSADHRVLDGATVARCAEIGKGLVEDLGKLSVLL